jgi:ethanolamine utilization protein EutN
MLIGKVIGSAVSTIKHQSMKGQKLLVVQPHMADGLAPDGDPLVVVDGLGAGVGDSVMITSDGRGARELLGTGATPVRWTIIGIKDPSAANIQGMGSRDVDGEDSGRG